jgi:SulP family sulfate permease
MAIPLPRSVTCLRTYSRDSFVNDLIAGVTVGIVALPLAMAFAIASGLTPQAGIYCAVVAGFLISTLGGSRTQIGGPTGAFVVVVAGIVAEHGIDGLFMCTMMAGVIALQANSSQGYGRSPPPFRRSHWNRRSSRRSRWVS